MNTRIITGSVIFLLLTAPALANKKADALYEEAVRLHGSVSIEEVFQAYTRAAELGHPVAQYNVAMMYANGESVNVDYQQALYWFQKSTNRNFPPAQYRLGEMYFFGMGGLDRDVKLAAKLFQTAAEAGDTDAQMNLAVMLGAGDVLPLDSERALALMEEAEAAGNPLAEDYRKLLQDSDSGLFSDEQSRDYWLQQEYFWIDMAAEFGVREAEEALGRLESSSGHGPAAAAVPPPGDLVEF